MVLKNLKGNHYFKFHLEEDTPHEIVFMNQLLHEIMEDYLLALEFNIYVKEFYPNFKWTIEYFPSLEKVAFEVGNALKVLEMYFKGYDKNMNINHEKELGEIVTDFYIRYKGYSLIGVSGQKNIVTSSKSSNIDFSPYIREGFTIQIKKGVKKRDVVMEGANLFEYYPSLPTREYDISTQEYIEIDRDKYAKVLKPYNCLKNK